MHVVSTVGIVLALGREVAVTLRRLRRALGLLAAHRVRDEGSAGAPVASRVEGLPRQVMVFDPPGRFKQAYRGSRCSSATRLPSLEDQVQLE